MKKTLLCFGLGYSARALIDRLPGDQWSIRGTTRKPEKIKAFEERGITGFLFSRDQPLPPEALDGATHVLTSIAPDDLGDPILAMHLDQLRQLPDLQWIGYLGTTAVYGDRGGAWVDETSDLSPSLARAERRGKAERAWLDSRLPVHIFRLAGIYGPGRNALVNLKNGTARRIVKEGQLFSRIHVEDIATVLIASIARPNAGRIYNVCDDEPAPPQDVVTYAANLLDVPAPPEQPYEAADLSPMARTFYKDSRRVRNDRIKNELGIDLAFPTYRDGLTQLLDIDGQ